jgi:HK97 family phage portal protein
VSVPPADAQFLETRKFQTEEIARLFGVPPHMIGAVDKTTSWGTGIEQQTIGFVTYTLRPWITRFEQAITDTLLAPANHYAQWEVKGLLRGDTAQRSAWYQIARNIGVLSPNEIRLLEDEQPYDGGDATTCRSTRRRAARTRRDDDADRTGG